MSKSLNELQVQHQIWSLKNFPNETWEDILMGVTEEVGELNHYLLKQKQKIRGTYEEHEENAKDSVGDIIVYLTHLCTLRRWSLDEIIQKTFESVLTREWVKDPLTGGTATKAVQDNVRTD